MDTVVADIVFSRMLDNSITEYPGLMAGLLIAWSEMDVATG